MAKTITITTITNTTVILPASGTLPKSVGDSVTIHVDNDSGETLTLTGSGSAYKFGVDSLPASIADDTTGDIDLTVLAAGDLVFEEGEDETTVTVSTPVDDLFADPTSLVSLIGYDSRNNRTLVIDPKGNTGITVFDGASRAVQTQQHLRQAGQGQNPPAANQTLLPFGGGTITTGRLLDGNGRVKELVDDRGNSTRYQYDTLDRRTKMIFQDGSTRQYTYDAADDVTNSLTRTARSSIIRSMPLAEKPNAISQGPRVVIGTTEQTAEFDGQSRPHVRPRLGPAAPTNPT